jgi:hypothetical protein
MFDYNYDREEFNYFNVIPIKQPPPKEVDLKCRRHSLLRLAL